MAATTGPDLYQLRILEQLNRASWGSGHIYAGTVPHAVKLRRRAANKVARRSRQINRRGA